MAATPHLAGLVASEAIGFSVVHLDRCRSAGLSDDQVLWLVDSRRWRRLYPRVFATFYGPVPLRTQQEAALLYAGAGSALSHQSAGHLSRLCPEPTLIYITVPYPRQVDRQPGLELHRSRNFSAADVHPTFLPRRTRIERTVLDLLDTQRDATAALGLVADALRGRATTPKRVREALLAKPCTRWRRVVLDALPDLRAGAQSVLELRDAAIRRRHTLPAGERQAKRLTDGTEYLDVLLDQ